jgi:polysaccharide deacetylase 2 family uncharacterized protein YibQ
VLQSPSANCDQHHIPLLKIAALIGMLAACCAGCQRSRHKPLPEEEIHRITREFVFAANSVAPPGSEVHGEVGAFDKVANSADRIEIHLFAKREGNTYPPSVAQILQKFSGIATARGLMQDRQSESGDPIVINYRYAGIITHTVHIHLRGTIESRKPGSVPPTETQQAPRLAIILDDVGNDRAAAKTIFAMPYPLTISILPNHAHSVEIAEQARRRGYEVMLHLPMQSLGKEHAEAQELRSGMSRAELSKLIAQFLGQIPGVAGVNNHQGSQSTADAKLMAELMAILQEHKLFYIDSRTSAATVAYETAQKFGVRAAFRNAPFLDDVEQVAAVRKQIKVAIEAAEKKKDAIAIGHARPTTLQALKETLPQAQTRGVRLVFASELVR